MDPLNLLKTFFKQTDPIPSEITVLRPGQIVRGRILRLLSDNTAEVQIGAQKLVAKLEVSLAMGQPYLFQVQSGEEGKIRLKLVKGNGTEIPSVDHKVGNDLANIQAANQPYDQFITQFPIQLGNHTSNLTIQWNGRKKEDGKIDADYCRMFFFLELGEIGDTFVDVQIQNRVISLSVVNEREDIKEMAAPLLASLKDRLKELDYHLSSIIFRRPADSAFKSFKESALLKENGECHYKGVDIRI